MLGKLLKYDFKAAKIVLPFYGISVLIFGLLFAGASVYKLVEHNATSAVVFSIGGTLLGFGAVLSIFAVFGVSLAYVVMHFGKQTIGAQAQLMFTLPVSPTQFLISKLISGATVLISSLVYFFGIIFVFAYSSTSGYMSDGVTDTYILSNGAQEPQFFTQMFQVALCMALVVISGVIFSLLTYYLAVSVSGYISQNRVAGTLAAYVGIGFIVQAFMFILIIVAGVILSTSGLMINITADLANFDYVNSSSIFMLGMFALMSIFDGVMFCLCRHFFTKKLNLP